MHQSVSCLTILLMSAGLASGNELSDGELERRVQACVEPTCVFVRYTIGMNEATLREELGRHNVLPAETPRGMWKQYQKTIVPLLSGPLHLSTEGKPSILKPVRAGYLDWRHSRLVCHFKADVLLTSESKKIVLRDGNFPDTPGHYRMAMKGRSGATTENPDAHSVVARTAPIALEKLAETQKELAIRAEGEFFVSTAENVADDELFPRDLVEFVQDQKAPVFAGTGRDTWDHSIRERGSILRSDGKWHLWYTGYNDEHTAKKMLGYATSQDGVKWTRHPRNPIFDKSWTEDVHVTHYAGKFYMVAEGRDDIPHLLTSSDGISWLEQGRLDVHYRDGTPLSEGPYGTPTLWVEDHTWYLFYERGDRGVWLAQSTDLRVWRNVQDTPVIPRGPAEYDRHAIALNQVIRYGNRYYGVYHANADPEWKGPWTTCLAVSDDLVNWEKYPGNPVIRTNDSSGQLVFDGRQYRLYTMHPVVRVHFPRKAKTLESSP